MMLHFRLLWLKTPNAYIVDICIHIYPRTVKNVFTIIKKHVGYTQLV